jgi:hypothetical protein
LSFSDLLESEDKEESYNKITKFLEIKIKSLVDDVKFEKF